MAILLKNGTWIDWQSLEFKKTDVLVEKGEYGEIHFLKDLKGKNTADADLELDCSNRFITKSFAVGHHHVYSALARGMPGPSKAINSFHDKLKYIWWRLDKALDEESIYASALVTALACAKDGSTFVIDHHASPNAIEGSLPIIAKAFDEVGLSHLLCYEITDRDGLDKAQKGIELHKEYLKNYQGLIGLHASFTVGEKSIKQASDLMAELNSGVHIHVAEDPVDQKITKELYGKTVIKRLHDHGILDSGKSILGHCLHLGDDERNIIRNSKAWIVQNMESNLNNKVGLFNSKGLGNKIMLGTDGMHSDMIRSAQYAYFAGQRSDDIDLQIAYDRMRNVHHYLDQNSFKGDGPNNLVVLNYDGATAFQEENFPSHFLYGFHGGHVQDVISKGELIVQNHRSLKVNEADIIAFGKEQSLRLWKRIEKLGE